MKLILSLALMFVSLGALVGCSGELPPSMTPDAAVATADAARTDVNPQGTDVVVPTADVPSNSDAGMPAVCTPHWDVNAGSVTLCEGAAMCRPSRYDPCTGAQACTCGSLTMSEMETLLRYTCQVADPANDRWVPDTRCEAIVRQMMAQNATCAPGQNLCSVNLPEGVPYEPFFMNESQRMATFALTWHRRVPGGNPQEVGDFLSNFGYSPHGLPLAGILGGYGGSQMECAGRRCYWRRSPNLRSILESAEIEFVDRCFVRFREYAAGATEPFTNWELVTFEGQC